MANNKIAAAAARKNVSNTRKTAAVAGDSTMGKDMARSKRKTVNAATVKKSMPGQSSKKAPAGSDMVMLTQSEFDAILGAIGKLAVEKGMWCVTN